MDDSGTTMASAPAPVQGKGWKVGKQAPKPYNSRFESPYKNLCGDSRRASSISTTCSRETLFNAAELVHFEL